MIDVKWDELFQAIAGRYGYTVDQISALSYAQLEGMMLTDKSRTASVADIAEYQRRWKEKHGIQTS